MFWPWGEPSRLEAYSLTTFDFGLSPTFNGTHLNVYAAASASGTPSGSPISIVLNGAPQPTNSLSLGGIYSGNLGSDVADIIDIVQFGQPMSLSVANSNAPTQTRSDAVTGSTII